MVLGIFSLRVREQISFFSLSPCHPFLCPLLLSLSHVLCPLSHVFVLCLPSNVPYLMSLFLASCPPSPISWPCSLSPVLCTLSTVLSQCPFLWLYSTCPVLCSSISRPLFLDLSSSVPCFSYLRECEIFFKKIHRRRISPQLS